MPQGIGGDVLDGQFVQVGHGDGDTDPAPDIANIVALHGMTLETALLGDHRSHQPQIRSSADLLNAADFLLAGFECLKRLLFPRVGRIFGPDRVKAGDVAEDFVGGGLHLVDLADHILGIDQGEFEAGRGFQFVLGDMAEIGVGLCGFSHRDEDPFVAGGPAVVIEVFVVDGAGLLQGDLQVGLFFADDIAGQGGKDDHRPDDGHEPDQGRQAGGASGIAGVVEVDLHDGTDDGGQEGHHAADNEVRQVEVGYVGMEHRVGQGVDVGHQDNDQDVEQDPEQVGKFVWHGGFLTVGICRLFSS